MQDFTKATNTDLQIYFPTVKGERSIRVFNPIKSNNTTIYSYLVISLGSILQIVLKQSIPYCHKYLVVGIYTT